MKAARELGFRYDTSGVNDQLWPKKKEGLWDLSMQLVPFPGHSYEQLTMDYNFMVNQSGTQTQGDPDKFQYWGDQMRDGLLKGFHRAYDGNRAPLVIGNHFESWNGGTYMRADPSIAKELVWAGFDMVARANNHTGDYGVEGARLTTRHVAAAGLVQAGFGESLREAREARFLDTEITPRFPDGLVVVDGAGQFLDERNVLWREPSKIVIILYAPRDARAAYKKINTIASRYCDLFNQESVLRVDSKLRTAFVPGTRPPQ